MGLGLGSAVVIGAFLTVRLLFRPLRRGAGAPAAMTVETSVFAMRSLFTSSAAVSVDGGGCSLLRFLGLSLERRHHCFKAHLCCVGRDAFGRSRIYWAVPSFFCGFILFLEIKNKPNFLAHFDVSTQPSRNESIRTEP